eukprot:gene5592-7580_t
MSSNGQFISVVPMYGQIYSSVDSGVSWDFNYNSPIGTWIDISSDSTGAITLAVMNGGYIYQSINYGINWNITNSPSDDWTSISLAGNQIYAIATVYSGLIYLSINNGNSWTYTSSPTATYYSSAISSTGEYMSANTKGDGMYYSTNYGSTWILASRTTDLNWNSVSISQNDFGKSWNMSVSPNGYWTSLTSSSDGQYVLAVVLNQVYYSSDYGKSFVLQESFDDSIYLFDSTSTSSGDFLITVSGQ